jgi:hypothetical protein
MPIFIALTGWFSDCTHEDAEYIATRLRTALHGTRSVVVANVDVKLVKPEYISQIQRKNEISPLKLKRGIAEMQRELNSIYTNPPDADIVILDHYITEIQSVIAQWGHIYQSPRLPQAAGQKFVEQLCSLYMTYPVDIICPRIRRGQHAKRNSFCKECLMDFAIPGDCCISGLMVKWAEFVASFMPDRRQPVIIPYNSYPPDSKNATDYENYNIGITNLVYCGLIPTLKEFGEFNTHRPRIPEQMRDDDPSDEDCQSQDHTCRQPAIVDMPTLSSFPATEDYQ